MMGEELAVLGIKTIFGIDASEKMLERAEDKKVYTDLHREYIGVQKIDQEKYYNQFDIVTLIASFFPSLVPAVGLNEMVDTAKVGGYIGFTIRNDNLHNEDYKF